jgi:hypothetical protein
VIGLERSLPKFDPALCVGRDCRHGDLTLDGNDLHVEALDAFCHCAVLHIERADPFSPNIEAIYALRLLQGLAGGMIIPLLMKRLFAFSRRAFGFTACRLRFDHNLHARAGRDRGGTLDGYRGLAVRIPADYPALLAGRHSRLVSIYG